MQSLLDELMDIAFQGNLSEEQVNKFRDTFNKLRDEIVVLKDDLKSFKKYNETLDTNNDRLRDTIKSKEKTIDDLTEDIDNLEFEMRNVKAPLPTATLEDETKNKILREMHHNLPLTMLETLDGVAKGMMPSGILWKEVLC